MFQSWLCFSDYNGESIRHHRGTGYEEAIVQTGKALFNRSLLTKHLLQPKKTKNTDDWSLVRHKEVYTSNYMYTLVHIGGLEFTILWGRRLATK